MIARTPAAPRAQAVASVVRARFVAIVPEAAQWPDDVVIELAAASAHLPADLSRDEEIAALSKLYLSPEKETDQ